MSQNDLRQEQDGLAAKILQTIVDHFADLGHRFDPRGFLSEASLILRCIVESAYYTGAERFYVPRTGEPSEHFIPRDGGAGANF